MSTRIALMFVLIFASYAAHAMDRLPTIPSAQYSEEQRTAAADFEAARKAPLTGPFKALMYSPQLLSQTSAMGAYLRYHSAIGSTLSELVILITAREWSQDYEWFVHQPIAVKAGIRPEITEAIADGRRPTEMSEDEEIVYDFSIELHRYKRVSDKTFMRVEKRFGKKGVVDLTGINAYYALIAMQLNVAEFEIPKDAKKLPRFP